ncbi:lysozyme inhibitor LprI family protein [Oceanobacillus manasiensis]|uniref:lysozyme inhibitor LprI family protein n=1 Tax=Oceanobacillus manasiensis TaxID=586413 RepID=UPI00069409B7|nr:lysozyme inhibitor LprI family protein [Oceanobacillus manasiensis]
MNHKRRFLIGILSVGLLILAACESSSAESSSTTDNESDSNSDESTQANAEGSTTEEVGKETTVDEQAANDNVNITEEEDSTIPTLVSRKEEYRQKLSNVKKETYEQREESADGITVELKGVEGNLYDLWDGLINEIYGVLEDQLSSEEMEQLRVEQREWIKYRENTAE